MNEASYQQLIPYVSRMHTYASGKTAADLTGLNTSSPAPANSSSLSLVVGPTAAGADLSV
jgi:hypothetical protein